MAAPAEHPAPSGPAVPPTDPAALRASLTPSLRAVFDREWGLVMDQAKDARSLTGVHKFLTQWRYIAADEARDPGAYFRVLAKAAEIEASGGNPAGRSMEDVLALIEQRRQQAS
ncbi:hypothetical protein HLB23_36430 [Nocardia uniformis]|uniref:Uncharacterized protein n=1 Tax=Nocardia uniformis TaxID=53432 RepID=A0A849CEX7_9NOCA|nr:DUF6247 family protein [Nocardia uniformis]NNH75280.1 hypothetical protein [Nocardia uniformis]